MVNRATIIGRLGRDPEVRYSPSGSAICAFSVATDESWKDKTTGQKQEKTEWHNILCFGKLAEICGEYLNKGSLVYISGKLQTSSWEKDGITRYKTEIVANEMKMLGEKQHGTKPKTSAEITGNDDIPF